MNKSTIFKSLLFALPTSILLSINVGTDLWLKMGLDYDAHLRILGLALALSLCLIALPIWLALSSKNKYKIWIICLDVFCFLPFGTILYLISICWAISARILQKNTCSMNN